MTGNIQNQIDALLSPYFHGDDYAWLRELLDGDQERLLAALLIEMQVMNSRKPETLVLPEDTGAPGVKSGANYQSGVVEAGEEWDDVELGFTTSEIDLRRITDEVRVAFRDPREHGPGSVVVYDDRESPVAGIPARTRRIWYRQGANADGASTFTIDAWE